MADMQRVGPRGIYYDQSQGATRVHVTPSGLQQEQAAAGGGAAIVPSLLLRNQMRHALVR